MGSVTMPSEDSISYSPATAAAISNAKKLPYWQVNITPAEREEECPPFLQNLSQKDIGIISTPNEAYRIWPWEEVRRTVETNRLDLFQRVPLELRRYLKYGYYLKQEYGTVMKYMLQNRLGWEEPVMPKGKTPFEDAAEEDVKVLMNDWPYGIDERIVHLVVWIKFDLPEEEDGGDITDEARETVEGYMRRTFYGRVKREHVVWFKNWKALKSVGSVEHFHIMLFDPDPEFIHEITNEDKPMCASFV
ncbi:N-acetylglucosamine-induced protein 1 [Zalerion maritima]|uniref:N-acetylglucosamine-induced protein 1 n=1 Tax=Zalerion maritima TaxID=339359 RepID=A0AAD5WV64_9PEZI|nr:N-acetylglucosamine-induced protein 1 [Zalerion maritima]